MAGRFENQAGQLLGPLTTAWSMPDSCTLHLGTCSTCREGFRGQRCVSVDGDDEGSARDNASCWPPTTSGVKSPGIPFVGWGYYSPGLACPTGYSRACTAIYGEEPDWKIQFGLRPGETAVGCCPEGYTCTNRNGNTCAAEATVSTEVATGQCSGNDITDVGFKVFPEVITVRVKDADEPDGVRLVTSTLTVSLLAPMFQLNFRSTDLTEDTLPAETAPPSETSAGDKDAPAGAADDQQYGGLSVGAKAGIGAGVAAALLLGFLAAWLMYSLRKKRAGPPTKPGPSHYPVHSGSEERDMGHYAYSYGLYEAPAHKEASEMAGNFERPPVELPANSLR